MSNKKTYSLIIKEDQEIEFEGIISFDNVHGKHFRVLRDEMGYEDMNNELIYQGYKSSKKIDTKEIKLDDDTSFNQDIYEDTLIEINSMDELKNFLEEKGFECEVIPSEQYNLIASVSADGQDIGYEVISNSNKIKISNFAIDLFRAANNSLNNPDYEPIENEKAGSYEIELFNPKPNINIQNEIITIMNDIKNININVEKFWEKSFYYSMINSLINLSFIKHLDNISIKINQVDISLNKVFFKNIKKAISDLLNNKEFKFTSSEDNPPRAFDDKNKTFKLDTGKGKGTRFCKIEEDSLYKKIFNNRDKNLSFEGYYGKGVQSIDINKVSVLT